MRTQPHQQAAPLTHTPFGAGMHLPGQPTAQLMHPTKSTALATKSRRALT